MSRRNLLSIADEEYRKVLPRIRIRLRRSARAHHRFKNRTHRLHNSVATDYDRATRTVSLLSRERGGKPVPYAKFIIGGFRHRSGAVWAPDPFLAQAEARERAKTTADMETALQKAVIRYNKQRREYVYRG